MKIYERIDLGFWSGLIAILVGTVWILTGIIVQDTFHIYPLVLIGFGLWAVLKFDAGVKRKQTNKQILDDSDDLLED